MLELKVGTMADICTDKRINSPSERKDSAYRRSNKPFMEKKRRARINNCLGQLKTLVLQAMRKDTNQYSKLEKADILEMTVKHLRQLQRQHVSQAISQDPTVEIKYKAGFNECANEVARYLGSLQGVDDEVRGRLINHLGNVVTSVNRQGHENQQCSHPLNVQIPQHLNQGLPSVQSGCLLMPAGVQTSPLILQSNVSNVYAQGHTQAPSTSPLQHAEHLDKQICGSFQIVPNPTASGSVALYLGQSQVVSQQSTSASQAIPLYTSNTPPRTKASLKAFDESAFSKVSNRHEDISAKSVSPMSQKELTNQLDFQLHNIAVGYGRTPSPLKVEDVWRPW